MLLNPFKTPHTHTTTTTATTYPPPHTPTCPPTHPPTHPPLLSVGVGVGLRWVAVVRSVARSVVYATVSAAAAATTTATLRSHIGPSTAFTWSQQPELLAHAVLRGAPHLRVVRVLFRAQAGMLRQASAARHLKPSILAGGLSSSVGGGAAGDPGGRPQRETTAGDHGERPQQETTAGHHSGRPQDEGKYRYDCCG
jgi:hypothetical protein